MPPSRRKSSNTTTARAQQQTLAFGPTTNKVTKPSQPPTSSKKKKQNTPTDTDRLEKAIADISTPSPAPEEQEGEENAYPPPPERQLEPPSPGTALAIRRGGKDAAAAKKNNNKEAIEGREEDGEVKSEAEEKASRVSDAQVKRYWKGKEEERIAPRVHQMGLGVDEKILRHFDLSSQYGPCIGIPRMKRWKRAENLGLKPPVEVLAVLLKEEGSGNRKAERAFMEGLLTSRLAVNE